MNRWVTGILIAAAIVGVSPDAARAVGGSVAKAEAGLPAGWDAEDPKHPIPNLSKLDVMAVKKGGGATLAIVIATPLQGDRRSLERLMRKFDNYLGYINSPEFKAEAGAPTAQNTEVEVAIHPDSSPRAFDLIERCKPWFAENHATLVVRGLP